MRVLMTVGMDTEKANQAISDGSLPKIMKSALDAVHPEAAYFTAEHGKRTAFIFFDLKEPSDIPSIAEPFFQTLDASIDVSPAMDFKDVQAGLQKYASH